MNFYKETPEDRQHKKEVLENQIQGAVDKSKSSLKEWLVKPVIVASITAIITTSITVPITILLTNATNKFTVSAQPTNPPKAENKYNQ